MLQRFCKTLYDSLVVLVVWVVLVVSIGSMVVRVVVLVLWVVLSYW